MNICSSLRPGDRRMRCAGIARASDQAQSWKKLRRVAPKIEWHFRGLFPRVGFIVTNLARSAERVAAFYNERGRVGSGLIRLYAGLGL